MTSALGSGKIHARNVDFSDFAKEVFDENSFTHQYHMDFRRSYVLNLDLMAGCILEDASNRISYWANFQH